jgi:small-conductance mechanosensitive channel
VIIKALQRKNNILWFAFITLLLVVSFLYVLTFSAVAQDDPDNPLFFLDEKLNFPTLLLNDLPAAVMIEGRQIFTIGKSDQSSAEARAEAINSRLETAVERAEPPQIKIQTSGELSNLYLNGNYLLTVTHRDVSKEETVQEIAESWQAKIEQAIIQAQLERTPKYLRRRIIFGGVILVGALVINRFLQLLGHYPATQALSRLIPRVKASDNYRKTELSFWFKFKLALAKISLWSLALYSVTELFPLLRELRYEAWLVLKSIFTTSLFSLGDRPYSFIDLIILIGLFWGLFIATGKVASVLRTRILTQIGMNRGSQEVIFMITRYGLIAFGTIILLQVWGLNLSSLTILGSALGVGIGFGFQDIAKNFASGLVLLFERSVQVGDFIQVGNYMGTVQRVGARSILLTTLDRVSIIVPNSRLLTDDVINWSHDSPTSRIHIPLGVAYGSDTEAVKSLLLKVAQEHPEVLTFPSPQVFFIGLGDSSLDFELLVWICDPSRQAPLKSDLYFRIEKALRADHIEIPFPQRDLYLRSEKLPLSLSPQLENALLQWLKNSKQ